MKRGEKVEKLVTQEKRKRGRPKRKQRDKVEERRNGEQRRR